MRKAVAFCISLYQTVISPLYFPCCRFTPSCSEYARQAVISHGVLCGVRLALWRLLRCHPLCSGGYDPVPTSTISKRD